MAPKKKETLFLIDGSALAYRSHFAFVSNPLKNAQGMETSAAYGFANTLLRLIEKEKPDHLAVVFDTGAKTFRHEKYPDYKATREKMPDELKLQLPYINEIVKAMHIPLLAMDGFEADDILGTLAKTSEKKNIHTFLVGGDKDFMQLLSPNIEMYTMKKGETEITDTSGPVKKWGVPVEGVVDFLALMGDASDHVPGVPGVGEKTAAKLIQAYGSLENIYKKIDSVAPAKLQQNLKEHEKQAWLCKELVTIKQDVPVEYDFDDLKLEAPDTKRLSEIFKELNFSSLIKLTEKVFQNQSSLFSESKTETPEETPNKTTHDRQYHLVKTREQLLNLVETLTKSKLISFDTETTSLSIPDAHLVGLSFSTQKNEAYYVPVINHELSEKDILKTLKPVLENPNLPKGGHNIKYDVQILSHHGVHVTPLTFDTMIESYLLDPEYRQHNLDALAQEHLNLTKIPTTDLIGVGKSQITFDQVDVQKVCEYACEDADVTLQLHHFFAPQLKSQNLENLYQMVELPLLSVLADMETTGVLLDYAKLKKLSVTLSEKLKTLEKEIHDLAGGPFNINSPKQLGPILFERLEIQKIADVKRVKKTKTGFSTDQDTLEKYRSIPIVDALLEYRNLNKLLSTYIDAIPELVSKKTNKIHASFNQTVAATGRLSSSDPNLQNIPIRTPLGKEIRESFIPSQKDWVILSADYSQIELRILAHLSNDPTLIETFQNDEDVHRRTASVIFDVPFKDVSSELRNRAKAINFGVLYGMGPQRLAKETGITLDEAKNFIESYFTKYASIKEYLSSQIAFAKANGYVTTLLGRRRKIHDITSKNPGLLGNAERIATNTPIQGSAADLMKVAMINIFNEFKHQNLKTKLLIQVHDELVFECPKDELKEVQKIVEDKMKNAIELNVPLKVDMGVGKNWAQAH